MSKDGSPWLLAAIGATLALILTGCPASEAQLGPRLRLATTTSTKESGLLDVLLPAFEAKSGVRVEVIAKGTGAALRLAREGRADVVLAHARDAEEAFVREGYGVNRCSLMYNDFVLLGPPGDPAEVSGLTDVAGAYRRLHERGAPLVSRGDGSGTSLREQTLWKLAGVTPDATFSKQGMLATLVQASAGGAYVLSDRSTYLFHRDELNLAVLVEGDQRLFNPYGVMAVNPDKVAGVAFAEAMELIRFLAGPEGQTLIRDYGRDRFGKALFTPLAIPAGGGG